MSFASLNGIRIVSGSLTVPLYGMWSADLSLATPDVISGPASVVLGNLTLTGAIYRQSVFAGARTCRLAAGSLGWRKTLRYAQYGFASGVMLSVVLRDAALEVGETINVATDRNLGAGYIREACPAQRLLRLLAGPEWYIDPAGVTQAQAWPDTTVATEFTVIDQQGGEGRTVIATEDYAAWLPGASFSSPLLDGTYRVNGVRYAFTGDGLFRLEVLTQ